MSDPNQPDQQHNDHGFFHNLDMSAVLTVVGIILLFSTAIGVTLLAPRFVDPTWTKPCCSYQVQMYQVSDPNFYISSEASGSSTLQAVYHLKADFTLLAFHESDTFRIVAPENLEKFITRNGDPTLMLTSDLLLLRKPQKSDSYDAIAAAEQVNTELQDAWEKENPSWKEQRLVKPGFAVFELFAADKTEAFAIAPAEGTVENWVDENFKIIDETPKQDYHQDAGVIYINNPVEYRIKRYTYNEREEWRYDPSGERINSLDDFKKSFIGFRSRAELIALGEHIYAIEGCWYCHTDQTRTLVQDVVLNGSDSYPAPPSSASEYIYQKVTFPGTRRIGPDISRVGIKRPSRDWHKGHFWSPKTASQGSIMPAFHHFFDSDPRGTSKNTMGIPNYRFEAIYQYMMTKGTRITPPTQAWWLGKDPIRTKEIIEGQRRLPK
ncbi:MAG TPA: cbb3-type cytochrome c oxidase subunit II [Parachlamydiaceae bacterium]|nr:cbb3-type cytochrome c oxidase subunit II [Parachlamydiaceae bacterium]